MSKLSFFSNQSYKKKKEKNQPIKLKIQKGSLGKNKGMKKEKEEK